MLGIAEQRPLRRYQVVKRLLRCSSKFGEVPGGGYRAVGEPRRRGSFFHAWPVKEKERAYRPPKAAKLSPTRCPPVQHGQCYCGRRRAPDRSRNGAAVSA